MVGMNGGNECKGRSEGREGKDVVAKDGMAPFRNWAWIDEFEFSRELKKQVIVSPIFNSQWYVEIERQVE